MGKSVRVIHKKDGIEKLLLEESSMSNKCCEPGQSSVGVTVGLTRNLGNFESLRVDVHRTDWVATGKVDDTYDEILEWVSDKVDEATEQGIEALKG